mgnify:CR=1 FL=1
MVNTMRISLTVNGVRREVEVKPYESLFHVLRDKLYLRSVKGNCFRGECGVCTVIMNDKLVKSCQVLAVEADGAEILTAEGLSRDGKPSPIQRAFIEKFGFQCGFCTPAFILAGHWIAKNMPKATDEEIKEILNGIVCRCTGYLQIIEAIKLGIKYYRESSG